MSKTIDERVVEMRFDNKQFESNVNQTMSTLDKFKQKLNLSGASKGLEEVGRSAKNVDVSSISSGLDSVKAKFSALQVMGVTALANITNSAVNAGKRLVSAFTIDPVKSGFEEYETQINSVQTILANTQKEGTKIGDVNKALDELNLYADKTIYNFTEMTRNIGTFTAAGVKLKTSVSSIQGIANLAAVSGSNAQQASTAMYQLSQALAAGKVQLMDWKSVENAGMGGQVFQDALKKTAKEHGVAVDEIIKKSGSFRESLQKGWITSKILTETLGKMTKSGAAEYLAKLTGVTQKEITAAQKAVETNKDGSASYDKLAEKMAKSGKITKKEALETLKMADTAEDAATKVKTFSQLMDTLKEAAQSGWSQTWRILVGDFEEAKDLFTPLNDFFSGIINNISNARNAMLKSALGKSFKKLGEEITAITKHIKKTADGVKEASKSLEKYGEIVNQIIRGDWGNGQERFDKLTKAGYDWAHAQNLVNEKLGDSTRYETKYAEAKNKSSKVQGDSAKSQSKNLEALTKMSDAELKHIGLNDKEIKSLRQLKKEADKVGMSVSNFSANIDNINGRWLIFDSFKTIGKSLVKVLHSVKDAWDEVFHGTTDNNKIANQRAKSLYNLIAAFHKLSMKLKVNDETADKIKRTFKGLFAIIKLITSITGGTFKTVFTVAQNVLGAFNLDILDVTASVGDVLVKFSDWVSQNSLLTKAIKFLTPYITIAVKAVKDWINAIIESGVAQKVFDGFVSFLKSAFSSIKGWIIAIKDSEIAQNIISGLVNGLKTGASSAWDAIVWLGTTLLEKIKAILGIHSPSTEFFEIGGNIISGLFNGLKNGASWIYDFITDLGSKIINIVKNLDIGTVIAGILAGGMFVGIKKSFDFIELISEPLHGLNKIFDSVAGVIKASQKGIAKSLKGLAKTFKAFAFKMRMDAIKDLVISVTILIAALIVLAHQDTDKLWDAVGVLGAVVGMLAALVVITEVCTKSSTKIDAASKTFESSGLLAMLIGIAGAILLIAIAVKMLGGLNQDQAIQGFIGVGLIATAIAGVILVFGKVVKGQSAKNIDGLGKMLVKMSVAILLMAIVIKMLGRLETKALVQGFAAMMGFVGIIALLTLIAKMSGGAIESVGKTMIQFAAAMLLMAVVIGILGHMDPQKLAKGYVAMLGFVGIIALLTLITKLAGYGTMERLSTVLLSMSASMFIMTIVMSLLGHMDPSVMAKGIVGIGLLVGVIALLVYITKLAGKDSAKISSTLLAMSASIAILAAVAVVLSLLDIGSLVKGIVAVGILTSFMVGLIYVTKYAQDSMKNIIALTVAVAVMAAAVVVLSLIDTSKLVPAVAGMIFMMTSFGVMCKLASNINSSLPSLIIMVGVVAILAGVVVLLSTLQVESVMGSAISLSALLLAVSAAMFIVSKVPVASALQGALGLLAMAVPLLAFVGILYLMNNVQNALTNAMALTLLAGALTLMLIPLTLIGSLIAPALLGVLALLAMAVPLVAFVGVLYLMEGLQNAMANVIILTTLLNALTSSLLIVSLLGPLAIIGVVALTAMIGLVGIMGAFMVAIGALNEYCPMLQTFLEKSLPILELLGQGIGRFLGGLVTGILDSLDLSGLTKIGNDLSMFMMSLQPFILGANMIDAKCMEGVKSLAMMIVILTAAKVLDGLTSWLTGGSSLADFGKELVPFGISLAAFAATTAGINGDQIKKVAQATKILAEMASEIPNKGGLVACITGDNSLAEFGKELISFGPYLAMYSMSVATVNTDLVKNSAKAAMELVKLAEEIPNTGGLVAKITGDNSLAEFGKEAALFGPSLAMYSMSVATVDTDLVKNSAKAAMELVKLAEEIPNTGGLVAKITGDNSLAEFGKELISFGPYLAMYSMSVATVNTDLVKNSAKAAMELVKLAEEIPNTGGLVAKITGDNSLAEFGKELEPFGTSLSDYSYNILGIDTELIKQSASAALSLAKMANSLDGYDYDDLEDFPREDLTSLGTTMKQYSDNVNGLSLSDISNSSFASKIIASMIDKLSKIDYSKLKMLPNNLSDFGAKLKSYSSSVSGIDKEKIVHASTSVESISRMMKSMNGINVLSIKAFKTGLADISKTDINSFVKAFEDSAPKASSSIKALIKVLNADLKTGSNTLKKTILSSLSAMLNCITDKNDDFKNSGIKIVNSFINGITKNKKNIPNSFTSSLMTAVTSMRTTYYAKFYNAGSYLVTGFCNGISENQYKVVSKAKTMALFAEKATKKQLGIHSPSKIFRKIGSFIPLGFAQGIGDFGSMIQKSSASMGDRAIDGTKNAIYKISKIANMDIDSQPTIRPVVDLSDVSSSVNSMNKMFNINPSIGVISNVRSISSSMNSNQNGNGMLLSAIDKLNDKMKSGDNVNVTVNVDYTSGENADEIANDIAASLQRAIRRGV